MKKIIALMLLAGITGNCIAQTNVPPSETDKIFAIPDDFVNSRFSIDLGKGNTMQVELGNIDDRDRIKNIDSLIAVFLKDIVPLKDSLADDQASRRIDHLTDLAGRKKIRIQITKAQASTFVIQQGELAALKSEQDTVNLIGVINAPMALKFHKPFADVRYYRISFFLNDLNDLKDLQGIGLGEKIAAIPHLRDKKWKRDANGDWRMTKGDQSISAKTPGGTVAASSDYLSSFVSANVQNYKNQFVPSFSLGIEFQLNGGKFRRKLALTWDPHFVFLKNSAGKLETFHNSFFTVRYNQERKETAGKESYGIRLNPNYSLSWLKHEHGGLFDKNTFRLGLGQFSLYKDKITVEPGMYFTDLFMHTTPGIKIGFNF